MLDDMKWRMNFAAAKHEFGTKKKKQNTNNNNNKLAKL